MGSCGIMREQIKRLTLISDLAELGAAAPFPSAIK
jgi:hypothetical protein